MMNYMNSCIKKEVALIGANTTFGKMTSFLLKQSPLLSKLTLYDDKSLKPLDDIKYINTPCQVSFVNGREHMSEAIKTADIIIIGDDNPKELSHEAALISRAPCLSYYVQQIANHNSDAIIVVATNPVSMTVPLAAEVLKNLGKLDEKKLIGMTNVENIKARSILAHHLQIGPGTIDFPVIGGLTSETSVPLLSNMCPRIPLSKANLQKITCAVKTSATKLNNAEGSQESLNRAYATAKLLKSIITGLNGHYTVETVLSYQKIINHVDYFSLPVLLGETGVMNHITLPNISQHEKYLLSHAIACMAADCKTAKNFCNKLPNSFMKPISTSQNKLNKLKPLTIQNKQPQSQYASIHNGTKITFLHRMSNKQSPTDIKLKSTMDHIASTINYCNENIKKSIHQNKLKSLKVKKPHIQYCSQYKKINDTTLIMEQDSFKVLHQAEEESSISEVNSTVGNENIDEINNLNQVKFINIKHEIPRSQCFYCVNASNTLSTNSESINKEKNPAIYPNSTLRFINKHPDVKRSLALDNLKLASESEKVIDEENAEFKLKIQDLTTPKDITNLNTEEKVISADTIVNLINKTIASPELDNKAKKCVVEEDKLPVKYNNRAKHNTTSENISTDPQQKSITSENLEKIFTSNIIRMVNEVQYKKSRPLGTSEAIRNQSQHTCDERTNVINFGSKCNINNDKRLDLFKIRSTKDDKNPEINKTDRQSISDPSFVDSNDSKTSGKKYSLQTNQPHWILHSMLFKSEKYQSSKGPILSRNVSSESHDNKIEKKQFIDLNPEKEIGQIESLEKSQASINKLQESLWSQCMPSLSQDNEIKNKEFINSNSENKKKQINSLPTFRTNIKSPRDSFLTRCMSSECYDKDRENEQLIDFNSENKTKEITSPPKLQTNINKSNESLSSCYASSESNDEEFEGFKPEEKVRQVNSHPKSQTNINRLHEPPLPIISQPDTKFRSPKQKNVLNPKESTHSCVFENFLQKQKDSISSGPKIASFRTKRSEDSFSVIQRKAKDFEMLGKVVNNRNNRNHLQKLHLLTSKSKECVMKDIVPENEIKSLGIKDSQCRNDYLKKNKESSMTKISKQQISETNEKSKDNVPLQITRADKKNNSIVKEEEHEKYECKAVIDNNSKKSVNSDTCNISNDQLITIPSKCMQKEINSINTQEVKMKENSLEHISSKESENHNA